MKPKYPAYKINEFEEDIKKWTKDEIYPAWDEEEQEMVQEIFGGVTTGKIYRGMKINSEKDLDKWKNIIENKGGFHDLEKMVSFSPDRDTAKSFMEYTKSYDPSVMASGFKILEENGCAGRFGALLLEIEPTKDNILWKNYRENQFDDNNDFIIPSETAETEAFVKGNIKITNILIQYPINKDDYLEKILNTIQKPSDLNNTGYHHWIKKNLSKEESNELARLVIKEALKNNDYIDVFSFIMSDSPCMFEINQDILSHFPQFNEIIIEKAQLDEELLSLFIENKKEKVYINKVFADGFSYFDEFKFDFIHKIKPLFKELNQKDIIEYDTDLSLVNGEVVTNFTKLVKRDFYENKSLWFFLRILHFCEEDNELMKELISTNYYQENRKMIVNYIKEHILEAESTYDKKELEKLNTFIMDIQRVRYFLYQDMEIIQELTKKFFNYIPTGHLTKEQMKFLMEFSNNTLGNITGKMTGIIQEITSVPLEIREYKVEKKYNKNRQAKIKTI